MQVNSDEANPTETPKLKLLLVDDDPSMHEFFELCLDEEYFLSSALNVEEAIAMIEVNPPDIIITDAMMPGDSGFSLINRLKSQPNTANIPVILWTILEEPNGSVMDSSGKADFMIPKPFHLPSIEESLKRARVLIAKRTAAVPISTTEFEVIF